MSQIVSIRHRCEWILPRKVIQRAGVRAGVVADFQLVCGAGPFELDVLVRELRLPHGIELAGQVTSAESIYDPVGSLPLSLVDADEMRIVSCTTTDPFGEFDLNSRRPGQFGLRLGEAPDAPVVLVWEEKA